MLYFVLGGSVAVVVYISIWVLYVRHLLRREEMEKGDAFPSEFVTFCLMYVVGAVSLAMGAAAGLLLGLAKKLMA